MRKKALLAVMMAMVLLLSSCALIVKDEAVDNATEIIRMGDQVITKEKVKLLVTEKTCFIQHPLCMLSYGCLPLLQPHRFWYLGNIYGPHCNHLWPGIEGPA